MVEQRTLELDECLRENLICNYFLVKIIDELIRVAKLL